MTQAPGRLSVLQAESAVLDARIMTRKDMFQEALNGFFEPLSKNYAGRSFFSFVWVFFPPWPCQKTCRVLAPQRGIKPVPPPVGVWSCKHWSTRELQGGLSLGHTS